MARNGKWSKLPGRALNGLSNWLVGTVGLDIQGAMVLTIRGRRSGAPRSLTVNPLELDGHTYLLSPRGQTQWVKNLLQAQAGSLKRGRDTRSFHVVRELTDAEKPAVIQAYVSRWHWQVGKLMGVPKQPDAATLDRIAPNHPVFEIAFDS